jgi:hypothetical protein
MFVHLSHWVVINFRIIPLLYCLIAKIKDHSNQTSKPVNHLTIKPVLTMLKIKIFLANFDPGKAYKQPGRDLISKSQDSALK